MFKRVFLGIAFLGLLASGLSAADKKEPEQPAIIYGDYCVSSYGYCTREMTTDEATIALRLFFEKRGLVSVIRIHMVRFTRADIYRGPHLLDSIVLDRKTGKMRSIY